MRPAQAAVPVAEDAPADHPQHLSLRSSGEQGRGFV
jgi:hypothetical protein